MGRCIAIWFAIALPFSPSIWRLYANGPACFTPAWTDQGVHPATCLIEVAFFAPFAVIFGPIGHDEELPQSELPEVLLTAFFLAVLIVTLRFILKRRRLKIGRRRA